MNYEIKSAKEAKAQEIFFDKNSNTLSYKHSKGIIDPLITAEDLVNAISAIPTVVSPTTATVNITSAQILAMGTTPITLLPAPGVGKYYDIEKIVFEYTHNTYTYTVSSSNLKII